MTNDVQLKLESALLHFSKGLEILDDLGLKSMKGRIETPVLELDDYISLTNPENILSLIQHHWLPDPSDPNYGRDRAEGSVEDAIAFALVKQLLLQLHESGTMKKHKENNNDS